MKVLTFSNSAWASLVLVSAVCHGACRQRLAESSDAKTDLDIAARRCSPEQWQAVEDNLSFPEMEGENLKAVTTVCNNFSLFGVINKDADKYWENGIVYYRFDADLSPKVRTRFVKATEIWSAGVNKYLDQWGSARRIAFVEDVDLKAKNFVSVLDGQTSNSSRAGQIGGEQNLKFKDSATQRAVIHELGHVLGMSHEQSRCDRDSYIEIVEDNILPGKESNFKKRCTGNVDFFKYNLESIMQYSWDAFSKNGEPTMVFKEHRELRWEQTKLPHELDYMTVARGFMQVVFKEATPVF